MLKHALLTLTLTSGVAVAASGVDDVQQSEVQQSDPCDACLAACGQADAGTTVLQVYSELSRCGGVSDVVHTGDEDCSYSCLAAKCTADHLEAAYPYLATKKAC